MYGVASVVVTAAVLPILGVIAVVLRFYVRLRLKPTFVGIDDWMIAFSCLFVCAQGALQIIGALLFCPFPDYYDARYCSAHAILLG